MYVASTIVAIASYATSKAANAVYYIPDVTAPFWRVSSRGLASVSMVLEALNTLAVSQKTAEGEAAKLWSLVMAGMARVGAWDANVACVMGHVNMAQIASLAPHYQVCMVQCRRWFFSREEGALVEAEARVATMLLIIDRPHEPASFTECILCVLRALLQFHRSECSSSQARFFARAIADKSYAAHTAFWLAAHVYGKTNAEDLRTLVTDLGMTEESFEGRVREAHAALLELRI